jgi:hypothetical protein
LKRRPASASLTAPVVGVVRSAAVPPAMASTPA